MSWSPFPVGVIRGNEIPVSTLLLTPRSTPLRAWVFPDLQGPLSTGVWGGPADPAPSSLVEWGAGTQDDIDPCLSPQLQGYREPEKP